LTVAEDSRTPNVKLTKLEQEIASFDSVLDWIQKLMPDNMRVYDYVVQARDAIFRLQQAMRGLEIIEFAEPWIEPNDVLYWEEEQARNKEDQGF
jgi:hypothetical protein